MKRLISMRLRLAVCGLLISCAQASAQSFSIMGEPLASGSASARTATARALMRVVPLLRKDKTNRESLREVSESLAVLGEEKAALEAAPDKRARENAQRLATIREVLLGRLAYAQQKAARLEPSARAGAMTYIVMERFHLWRKMKNRAGAPQLRAQIKAAFRDVCNANECWGVSAAPLAAALALSGDRVASRNAFATLQNILKKPAPDAQFLALEKYMTATALVAAGFDAQVLQLARKDEIFRNGALQAWLRAGRTRQAHAYFSAWHGVRRLERLLEFADLLTIPDPETTSGGYDVSFAERVRVNRAIRPILAWSAALLPRVPRKQRAEWAKKLAEHQARANDAEAAFKNLRFLRGPERASLEGDIKYLAVRAYGYWGRAAPPHHRATRSRWARELAQSLEAQAQGAWSGGSAFDWRQIAQFWIAVPEPSRACRALQKAEQFALPAKKSTLEDEVIDEPEEVARIAALWQKLGNRKRADELVHRAVSSAFYGDANLRQALLDMNRFDESVSVALKGANGLDWVLPYTARIQAQRVGGAPPAWIERLPSLALRAKSLAQWTEAISPVRNALPFLALKQ